MPNGEFVGTIPLPTTRDVEGPDFPGTSIPTGPLGAAVEAVKDFFSGLFGGGDSLDPFLAAEARGEGFFIGPKVLGGRFVALDLAAIAEFPQESAAAFRRQGTVPEAEIQRVVFGITPPVSDITGRVPIPTPEQGGPPLVTEQFADLQTEGAEMPVDVPLLTSSFLPAVRSVAQPTIQGVVGGLAGGFLSEFLRPIQETGLGTVPMRQAVPQVTGCPTVKPSTRILRAIKAQTGVSINLSRAKSLIRELGLEGAARCLGISAQEVCALLIAASPRRRRGISASDIRIVKRTARRFDSLKHALGHLGGRPGHTHRRRHHHRHSHK